jgi:hypothetical protein
MFVVETVSKDHEYNSFGLWIHGVQYTKKAGAKVRGTYLPVLFTNRESGIETGMSNLLRDIKVRNRDNETQVLCGWRGTTFASIEWDGLHETPKSIGDKLLGHGNPPTSDNGLLLYRYIPTVRGGTADAEYPVYIPMKPKRKIMRIRTATSAKASFTPGSWDAQPTLHHIAQALSEVPIYSIVEATIEHGMGVEDFSGAEKIGPNL